MAGEARFQLRQTELAMPAASGTTFPADVRRVGLVVGQDAEAWGTFVKFLGVGDTTVGFPVPGRDVLEFYFSRHGPLPGLSFQVINLAGALNVTVLEIIDLGDR